MIRIFEKKRGNIVEGTLDHLKKLTVEWIDCCKPTSREIATLSKTLGIPENRLKKYMDEDARPRIYKGKKFSSILFAAPFKDDNKIRKAPVAIFITDANNVLTLRNKKIGAIERIEISIRNDVEVFKTAGKFLLELLQEIISDYFKIVDEIEDNLDEMERIVLKKPNQKYIDEIFSLKKSIIYIHKALAANREVITAIEKGYVNQIKKDELHSFVFLYNDIIQLIDIEETHRELATGILEMHLSQISNNLNIIVKKLTSWGALILIPTLIGTIYGMNFRNMPELFWKHGYAFALLIMAASMLITYFYFKKKDWL